MQIHVRAYKRVFIFIFSSIHSMCVCVPPPPSQEFDDLYFAFQMRFFLLPAEECPWKQYLRRCGDDVCMVVDMDELTPLLLRGIPDALRGHFWQLFCGAPYR